MDSLESLEVKASRKQPLCRNRTFNGSYTPKPSKPAEPDSAANVSDSSESSENEDNNNATNNKNKKNNQRPSSLKKRHSHRHIIARPKRHVAFAEDSTIVRHEFEPLDLEHHKLSDYFVLPAELQDIKRLGLVACKEARRTGLAGLLTEIYGTANDKDTQDRLNYWCRMASACRGLERFANDEMCKRRTVYRKRAVRSVLEAQEQLKNETGIDTANVLRRLSEAYTEQARVYAEKLGKADHFVVATASHPPPPPAAAAAITTAAENNNSNSNAKKPAGRQLNNSRKSRTARMKERAEASSAANTTGAAAAAGGEEPAFRRNNTTMTAVVLQQ